MRNFVMLVFCLAACGRGGVLPLNEPADPPNRAEFAERYIVKVWTYELGPLGDPPPILWFSGICLEYEDSDAGCMHGAYLETEDGSEIHLLLAPHPAHPIMAHELLHWAFDVTRSNPDDAHADALWDEEFEVNQTAWSLR